MKPLCDLDHWGILNVVCVLQPNLAPVEDETKVVMPQTKAVLYFLFSGIPCKPTNWQMALDLITRDGKLLEY